MPYVSRDRRARVLLPHEDSTPGDLNYAFTSLARDYLTQKGVSYSTLNDVVGALESAKLEFYRRVVTPYENGKIQENGDVY